MGEADNYIRYQIEITVYGEKWGRICLESASKEKLSLNWIGNGEQNQLRGISSHAIFPSGWNCGSYSVDSRAESMFSRATVCVGVVSCWGVE